MPAAGSRATLGPMRPMLGALADFQAAQEEYEGLVSQRAASRDPTRRWLEGESLKGHMFVPRSIVHAQSSCEPR